MCDLRRLGLSEERPDFRQAFRKLSKTLWSHDDEHPPTEVLVAYHEEELSEDHKERVREHVAGCAVCARLLLDYVRFGEEHPADEAEADRAKARDWDALRRARDDSA